MVVPRRSIDVLDLRGEALCPRGLLGPLPSQSAQVLSPPRHTSTPAAPALPRTRLTLPAVLTPRTIRRFPAQGYSTRWAAAAAAVS